MTRSKSALIALLAACSIATAKQAAAAQGESMTLALENDVFTGSDNNYTNGIGFSWVSGEVATYPEGKLIRKWTNFWSFLPFVGNEDYKTYASWSVVQEMDTPDNIKNPNPPPNDQPYAGILYVDTILYAKKDRWAHAWEFKVGVVGPAALAEQAQKGMHRIIGSDEPMGWDTQLPNEPVINIGYTVAHVVAEGHMGKSAAEWRIVPVGNVGLGTYFTGIGVGAYGEFGWNLVDALGGTALRAGLNSAATAGVGPVSGWSIAFFAGAAGYGVARYLPLDGDVFRDSRSVDTKSYVGQRSAGFSVRHRGFVMSLAVTHFTPTFESERAKPDFGTLSVSWFL
jgi:lipid A 3-O-deacylase